MTPDPGAALLTLLRTEAEAIITGQYAAIDNLSGQKTALFTQLTQARVTPADLALIADNLARNQALFAAAIQGITTARHRLAELRKVRDGLQVYDRSGQLTTARRNRPDLVRKA